MFKSKFGLTFGTDPEVFSTVIQGEKNLVISPALLEKFSGLKELEIKGRTKEEKIKHPFYIKEKDFSWMMDGVAWEATIKPAKTPEELYNRIRDSLESFENKILELDFNGDSLFPYKKPVVNIEPEMYLPYLNEEKILQGFIFGCDPDEDAILPDYKCEEIDVQSHLFRYGGGHIHFGSENKEIAQDMKDFYKPFLRLLAIFVGNISIAFSDFPAEEKIRAQTYGKPGRFRFQDWGIEYRSPSNSWISNLETIRLIFEGTEKAVYLLQNPQEGSQIIQEFLEPTINAILSGNKEVSELIIKEVLF